MNKRVLKTDKLNKLLYKNIKKILEMKNIKIYELAEKIGKANSTTSEQLKRLSDGKGVMTDTLFKIMLALEIEPTELFK